MYIRALGIRHTFLFAFEITSEEKVPGCSYRKIGLVYKYLYILQSTLSHVKIITSKLNFLRHFRFFF